MGLPYTCFFASSNKFNDIAEAIYDANQLIDYDDVEEYYRENNHVCSDRKLTNEVIAAIDEFGILTHPRVIRVILCAENLGDTTNIGKNTVDYVEQCINAINDGYSIKTYHDSDTDITVIYGIKL